MFALVSVITSMTMVGVWDGGEATTAAILIGCLAGFGAGTGIGVVNGIGVAVFRVPPFMMTLAMSSIVFGIALMITGGTPIYGMPGQLRERPRLRQGNRCPDPDLDHHRVHHPDVRVPQLDPNGALSLRAGAATSRRRSSPASARASTCSWPYVVTAAITTIGAIMLTARLESGEGNIGKEYPLLSIAACVIGGVSLFGGTGRLPNVVLGAIFIILVQNGMNLLRISSYMQLVVIGILLILAVIADNYRQKLLLMLRD